MTDDPVERLLAQWARERPDLDVSPMAVVGRISRLARRIDLAQRETFARYDLDPAGFDVLATLRRSGPPYELTPSDLVEQTMVTSGAVTKRLDRLEGAGLVERRVAGGDRRSRIVVLTEKGRELIDRAAPEHFANEARLLEPLTRAERATLARLLGKLGEPLGV